MTDTTAAVERFIDRWRDRLPIILETLVALGRAQTRGSHHWQGIA